MAEPPFRRDPGEQFAALLLGGEKVTAAGLRARSAADVLAAFQKMGLGAYTLSSGVVDGWVLPEDVYSVFDAGRQHDVPVIVGSNANEGPVLWERFAPTTTMAFGIFAARTYGDLAPEFFKLYPGGSAEEVWDSFMESQGDGVFAWQAVTWARRMAKVTSKAYLYHFTRVPPIPNSDRYGAHHAAEIPYVFANLRLARYSPDPVDLRLEEVTSGLWVRFAATGDPNGEGLPAWPSYDSGEGGAFLELGDEVKTGRDLKAKPIAFFDRHNASLRAVP